MTEFYEPTHIRGQQTLAVWGTFALTFTVGPLTFAQHQGDVALLLTVVNDRDLAQDASDDGVATRNTNYNFITDLNVRATELIEATLPEGDELVPEVGDIRAVDGKGQEAILERARRLISLWTRVNAKRAALVPALPGLTVNLAVGGAATLAQFQAAVTNHPVLLQTLKDKDADLSRKKSVLRQTEARVDKNNKKWFAAWAANFPAGTAEHDALSQITTEEGTSAPTALVIATATASGLSAAVSYTAGGGAHATSLRLLWRIVGVDADFTHFTSVVLAGQTVGPFVAGQTVEFKTRGENSVGSTDSAVKSVSF